MDFSDHRDFIRHNRDEVAKEDQDNVMWISGKAGDGKSNLGLLLSRQLDHTFEPAVLGGDPRIAFSILGFLRGATGLMPTCALQGDELNLFGRTAMGAENVAFLKWVKDSRGRNLHLPLIFPDDGLVDEKLMLFRAKWRIHVTKEDSGRRVADFYEPREPHKRDPGRPFGNWRRVMDPIVVPKLPDDSPLRQKYRELKAHHMASIDGDIADELEAKLAGKRRRGEHGLTKPPKVFPKWRPEWGDTIPAPPTKEERLARRLAEEEARRARDGARST